MDPRLNPYQPGAGTPPPVLTGRDPELRQFELLLNRLSDGKTEQSPLVIGLRGVGKTVLLQAFGGIARDAGWYATVDEVTRGTRLPALVATVTREMLLEESGRERVKARVRSAFSVLKSFTISTAAGVDFKIEVDLKEGVADSGDLARDLGDLLITVGEVAQAGETGAVFLFDEIQNLSRDDFEAMIGAIHRSCRLGLPVAIVGAGLPMLARLAGEAKSYAERLFAVQQIGALSQQAAMEALEQPAKDAGVKYTAEALDLILAHSQRYPYFLQEYGKHAWNTSVENEIDIAAAERAHALVRSALDTGFFQIRFERATRREQRYMSALAEQGDGPRASAAVAKRLGFSSASRAGSLRESLIKKGLIFSPRHGEVEFSVPLFADYMRRLHPLKDVTDEEGR